jgi:hypothetical protein
MALGTNHMSATTLAVDIPKIWGGKINDFYRAKLVMAKTFTNRSDELADGGDTLYTPNLTEMSANAKAAATQVTLNNPTETKQNLVVDQHFEVSFLIEDKEAAQVKKSYTLQQRYMKNAAFTAAKKLEDAIATLFQGFSTSVGTTTVALSRAVTLSAVASLETANVDFSDATWYLHPKTLWVDIGSIDAFALSLNTANANNLVTKQIGPSILGRPVVTSTRITKINTNADYCGALAVPDAIHWATAALPGQRDAYGVRMQATYIQEYLGTLVTCDILYGVIENRDAGGIKIVSAV